MCNRLALLALFCGSVAGQTLPGETALTVILKGVQPPSAILTSLEREVRSAMASSGMQLDWRSHDLGGGNVTGPVAIVQLRGNCSAAPPYSGTPNRVESEPLGQTHVADGKVLPFADVLCDAVHRLVDSDLRGMNSRQREELMGRALGRVVAHELYHILARTTDHTNHGISRPEQSRAELLAPAGSFGDAAARRIVESVAADGGAGR
jgi:hypothetical protein